MINHRSDIDRTISKSTRKSFESTPYVIRMQVPVNLDIMNLFELTISLSYNGSPYVTTMQGLKLVFCWLLSFVKENIGVLI